ncbi:MAG: Holliday junction resolvase RuvX [bacterium]|nr:Holliday junction resolvase RuvX [bacterium]
MHILAVDYGTKNIGLAWVDTGIGVALPFGVIKGGKTAAEEMVKFIQKEKIDTVVFGLPLGMSNAENPNTKRIREFAEQVENLAGVKIDFVNEMFSSQMADRSEPGVSRDEKSAMIILEDYLQKNK